MMDKEYIEVTLQQYTGNANLPEAMGQKFYDDLVGWIAKKEEREEAYRKWAASPEGKAELERRRSEELARWKKKQKFKKRWQRLHDWLVTKGCECDNYDCC